jgi:5-methylcytosine-specific restriction endonuclease McrA
MSASETQLIQAFAAELVLALEQADALTDQITLQTHNIEGLTAAIEKCRSIASGACAANKTHLSHVMESMQEQLALREALRSRIRKERRKLDSKCRRCISSLHKSLGTTLKRLTRQKGAGVRKQLSMSKDCPYCGKPIGSKPHADHIYPVSLGGRSEDWNMVYVCSQCNFSKRDMTLMGFIIRRGLDAQVIHGRLASLRKNF